MALARCLVQRPRLTLLDEPLASLDVHLRDQMMDALRDFHTALGGTLIYVTHDQHEAMALADRIAVLNNGRLEQVGTPQALHDQPQSRFVAEFIGRGRILTVETDPDGFARCGGLRFRVDAPPPHQAAGAARQVLVRPAAVRLIEGVANARVVRHRYRGQDHELELALIGAPESRLLCDHSQRLAPGSEVRVEVARGWLIA